jgi:hypothetical protein
MEKTVLTQEEINELKDAKDLQTNLLLALGEIEYQIQELELQKNEFREKMKNFKNHNHKMGETLQKKYGQGSINLETGEFQKV